MISKYTSASHKLSHVRRLLKLSVFVHPTPSLVIIVFMAAFVTQINYYEHAYYYEMYSDIAATYITMSIQNCIIELSEYCFANITDNSKSIVNILGL